jgi:hypothetical protein
MRIKANSATAPSTAFLARRSIYQKTDEARAQSTSLIVRPVTAVPSSEATMSARPLAALLAQLIAKAQDLPVSRERRRADPAEGARVYRAASNLGRPRDNKYVRVI